MFPKDSRRTRRSGGNGRRPGLAARFESLETRELLAFSEIGVPLPDLVVTGFPAPVATWGSSLAINATISNTTASSIIQPLSLAPGQYYLGVVIDPNHQLKQIQTIPQGNSGVTPLSLARVVGASNTGLPAAGVNYAGGAANVPVFPYSQSGYAVGASQDGTYPPSIYSIYTAQQNLSATSVTSTTRSTPTRAFAAAQARRAILAQRRADHLAMISERYAARHGLK